MVLEHCTKESIYLQVSNGLPIGYFGINDDISKIPKLIGDWLLRTVPDHYKSGTGTIVALPTNRRTRKIYNKGRIAWLMSLGFTEDMANLYFKVSRKNKRRWDHRVAIFVNSNFNLDQFIIDDIMSSNYPRQTCIDNGIYTTLNHGQIIDACNILNKINEL